MVLVSANQIYDVTLALIPEGIPLFIEKPPGLYPEQTKTLMELADKHDWVAMQVFVPMALGFPLLMLGRFEEGLDIMSGSLDFLNNYEISIFYEDIRIRLRELIG